MKEKKRYIPFQRHRSIQSKDLINQIKELYKYYHCKCWCYQKAYKYFKQLNLAVNMLSSGLIVLGTVGGVTLNLLYQRGSHARFALYSQNMVTLFSFVCHVIDRAYVSTDSTGGVGETIKRKEGVSQACLGKSTSFTLAIHNMVN